MKVSIIVPIYNVQERLRKCINSLINQTLKDIEIILVDDKSPDKCPEICDEYARNSGIEVATGEYLAFVDGDDYVDLNFYEKLYDNNEGADIIYGSTKYEINGKTIYNNNILSKNRFENQEIIPEILYNIIGHVNKNIAIGFTACKSLYKREIFDKYNIRFFSERKFISEDLIFNIDYIPKCKLIKFVENTYYHYCYKPNSLTKRYNEKRFDLVKVLYNEVVKKTKQIGIYEDVKKGINYSFIGNVRVCIKQEKMNTKSKAIENISKICEDELVQQVIRKDYSKTLRQRIFDFLIKMKKTRILYFIVQNMK